jgi:hypothetical protein
MVKTELVSEGWLFLMNLNILGAHKQKGLYLEGL